MSKKINGKIWTFKEKTKTINKKIETTFSTPTVCVSLNRKWKKIHPCILKINITGDKEKLHNCQNVNNVEMTPRKLFRRNKSSIRIKFLWFIFFRTHKFYVKIRICKLHRIAFYFGEIDANDGRQISNLTRFINPNFFRLFLVLFPDGTCRNASNCISAYVKSTLRLFGRGILFINKFYKMQIITQNNALTSKA